MAQEAVLKYLVDTNRPYSCADVTVNLRGVYSKGVVQKTLDALSESGKIRCKLYGKQKVFAAIQTETVGGDDDVEDFDAQVKSLSEAIADKTTALKTAEAKLKTLTSAPTTLSAKAQIEEVQTTISSMEKKLEVLKNSTEVVSGDEKKKILDEHEKMYREYRKRYRRKTSHREEISFLAASMGLQPVTKRKRMSSDMLEAILEGCPKPKKTMIEELCIETDEMVDFKVAN